MASETVENYLKCIYALQGEADKGVSTNAIAERLDTQASSVTDMLKKLKQQNLVNYKKYYGARLTDTGARLAVNIVRRHRLWEVFLVEKLGFNWDEVHDIAEDLEHVESHELIDRLDRFLGNPKTDPHGDPIPDSEGRVQEHQQRFSLEALQVGESGVIVGVDDSSASFLQYLDSLKLNLGVEVKVEDTFEFDQSMMLSTEHGPRQVSQMVTRNLLVRKVIHHG